MPSRNPEENLSSQSLKLGSCYVPVSIHWSFFLLLGIQMIMAFFHGFEFVLYTLIFYGPIHFVTVLVHEFAHAFVARKLGGEVTNIVLWPLGGLTTYGPDNAKGEFITAIAGPLVHLVMMGIWALLYTITNGGVQNLTQYKVIIDAGGSIVNGMVLTLFRRGFWLNIEIMVINVIFPIYPLDGIRILGAFFVMIGCSIHRAAKFTAAFGVLLSIGFVIAGIVTLFREGLDELPIIYMLLGALGIVSSNILFGYAKTDRLSSHPVFGQDCYKDHFNTPTDTVLPSLETTPSTDSPTTGTAKTNSESQPAPSPSVSTETEIV